MPLTRTTLSIMTVIKMPLSSITFSATVSKMLFKRIVLKKMLRIDTSTVNLSRIILNRMTHIRTIFSRLTKFTITISSMSNYRMAL
jgi:hypothetical protein